MEMKAYLDNNVVSSIARDDTANESDALDALMAAYDAGKVDLVTSELTLEEIRKYSGPRRKPVERTFRLLEKVPVVRWDELLGIHSYGDKYTWISSSMIQNDSLYDELLKTGLDTTDARHVFVAAKQACTVFLTCDGGVLARCGDISTLCGLIVQKPSALVVSQGW
jgi:predicted nucleic acid-binding protein